MPDRLVTTADLVIAPLTEEEVERLRAAMEGARLLRASMRQRRGGQPLDSSWELVREAREARSREL